MGLWSGGVHCCYSFKAFQLTTPIKSIFSFHTGNYGALTLKDLNEDKIQEILLWDDRFAYIYGLSFAYSPALPYYFCFEKRKYRENRYTDCTRKFPDLLIEELHKSLKQFDQTKQQSVSDFVYLERRKLALKIVALGYLLGQSQIWWEYFEDKLPKEDFEWLASHRLKIEKKMRERK